MKRYNTPLRYPGGKQRLSAFLGEIIRANGIESGHYVEPYAGGAGAAMNLLLGNHVSHVHLNDSCHGVYAFWRSVLTNADKLCKKVLNTPLSVDEWRRQQRIFAHSSEHSQLDVGFSFFYLNRCNRSGIVATAGLIGGVRQAGNWKMSARFPRKALVGRIDDIAEAADRITLKNWDAERFLRDHVATLPVVNTLVYCDPPYFHKAKRLYANYYTPADHARIAGQIQRLLHSWVVSYDSAREVIAHYAQRRWFEYDLQYNANRHQAGREVFIFSDRLSIPGASASRWVNSRLRRMPPMWRPPRKHRASRAGARQWSRIH